jgi:hypothetical protein
MREAKTYRSARRNLTNKHGKRKLNPLFRQVSGDNWKKDFPTLKEDKEGNQVPFVTYVGGQSRGKDYPYGSSRQGYDLPIIGG